ncbi:hypothetical protein TRVL_09926 [Trypanosoma vivax]|nr:hypothetical protein TRVL_09926 [Trypanosoma vivax]
MERSVPPASFCRPLNIVTPWPWSEGQIQKGHLPASLGVCVLWMAECVSAPCSTAPGTAFGKQQGIRRTGARSQPTAYRAQKAKWAGECLYRMPLTTRVCSGPREQCFAPSFTRYAC